MVLAWRPDLSPDTLCESDFVFGREKVCVCRGMYEKTFQLTLRASTALSVPSSVAVSPDRIKCAEPAFLSMHSHTW